MHTLKRITGAYLLLVAVAVAAHMVVEPLYYVSTEADPYSPFWNILNPFMALAIALAVVFGYLRMKRVGRGGGDAPVTRGYLCANTLYFGTIFIGLLFFWNWFNLWSPGFTAAGPETVSLTWALIDASLPLLLGATGVHLLGWDCCGGE